MHHSLKKVLTRLVVLCIILSFVGSVVFIVTHADHDCTGDHCQTCSLLCHAADMLKKLGNSTGCAAGLFFSFHLLLLCSFAFSEFVFLKPNTLFIRGIRLNN